MIVSCDRPCSPSDMTGNFCKCDREKLVNALMLGSQFHIGKRDDIYEIKHLQLRGGVSKHVVCRVDRFGVVLHSFGTPEFSNTCMTVTDGGEISLVPFHDIDVFDNLPF